MYYVKYKGEEFKEIEVVDTESESYVSAFKMLRRIMLGRILKDGAPNYYQIENITNLVDNLSISDMELVPVEKELFTHLDVILMKNYRMTGKYSESKADELFSHGINLEEETIRSIKNNLIVQYLEDVFDKVEFTENGIKTPSHIILAKKSNFFTNSGLFENAFDVKITKGMEE